MPEAKPNFTPKRFANIQIFVASCSATIVLILTVCGWLSLTQFIVRTGVIAAYCLFTIWGYRRFFCYVEESPNQRQHLMQFATGVIGPCAIYPFVIILITGTHMAAASASFYPMMSIMLGLAVMRLGYVRRVGDSLHCPHCEYPYEFPNDADAPTRCPECGKGWLGILKKGRKVKSTKLIFAGILIAILLTLALNPLFYIGSLAPSLPTPLLYASSYLTPTMSTSAWDELATRKLNPFWTSLMAKRVMGLRSHNAYETSARWFENMLSAGAIPTDLAERYYNEGLNAELTAPNHVKVGQAFPVALRVHHAASGSRLVSCVMFSGYFIDNDPAPIGRLNESQWVYKIFPSSFAPHNDALSQDLIARTPAAEVKIRCVYWLVYQPSFADQLKWQPDGTPGPLPAAVWSKRYELTKTIRVD